MSELTVSEARTVLGQLMKEYSALSRLHEVLDIADKVAQTEVTLVARKEVMARELVEAEGRQRDALEALSVAYKVKEAELTAFEQRKVAKQTELEKAYAIAEGSQTVKLQALAAEVKKAEEVTKQHLAKLAEAERLEANAHTAVVASRTAERDKLDEMIKGFKGELSRLTAAAGIR